MNTREKFEWDNANSPQSAVKNGIYNPNYSEWMEEVFIPELQGLIKTAQDKITDLGKQLTKVNETLRMEAISLTKQQIQIIKHSLGIDRGEGRNYFATGESSNDFESIENLVEKGLMVKRKDPISSDFIYHVTDEGKDFVN